MASYISADETYSMFVPGRVRDVNESSWVLVFIRATSIVVVSLPLTLEILLCYLCRRLSIQNGVRVRLFFEVVPSTHHTYVLAL